MAYLALLATATLFGGMVLFSFGVAPLVFRSFPTEEAGRVIRLAFPWYYLFVVACSALAAVLLLAVGDTRSAALMAIVVLVGLFARQVLMPRIDSAREGRASGDAAAARHFGRLHGFSMLLNFAQLALAAWVLRRFL
ncbi:MAG: DUF4149 domain-containing protein [Alphaproteobacteria bacterium]|nr:DUF4149 domain-containing protein [Alphaproteobacteria bacterium]MBV8406950.1 DUF4149 domain-containing protein [Alphaproteobacteria bacterium]